MLPPTRAGAGARPSTENLARRAQFARCGLRRRSVTMASGGKDAHVAAALARIGTPTRKVAQARRRIALRGRTARDHAPDRHGRALRDRRCAAAAERVPLAAWPAHGRAPRTVPRTRPG